MPKEAIGDQSFRKLAREHPSEVAHLFAIANEKYELDIEFFVPIKKAWMLKLQDDGIIPSVLPDGTPIQASDELTRADAVILYNEIGKCLQQVKNSKRARDDVFNTSGCLIKRQGVFKNQNTYVLFKKHRAVFEQDPPGVISVAQDIRHDHEVADQRARQYVEHFLSEALEDNIK